MEAFAAVYQERRARVCAVGALANATPPIRARLLDKHARWENGLAQELARRMAVDPDTDPQPRLIAAVTLAAYSTAVKAWVTDGGREQLSAMVSANLQAVQAGFDVTVHDPYGMPMPRAGHGHTRANRASAPSL